MKNITILPKLDKVRRYQLKCSALLTAVPLLCSLILAVLLLNFAQMNLFFLEMGGTMIGDDLRQAYFDQVQIEIWDVLWFIFALFGLTFGVSYVLMGWAISPFVNGERVLREGLKSPDGKQSENDWLSEDPTFHRVIWGLAQRLRDKNYAFDAIESPKYRYNWRFFGKFVISFFVVSLATGFVLGIMLSAVYTKIVSLAISLMKLKTQGHFFIAQEQLLKSGVGFTIVLSCLVYVVMGYYVTSYMSNMQFVFIRAVKEHHFPLKLRDSDIYHSLANAISEVAEACKLSRKASKE